MAHPKACQVTIDSNARHIMTAQFFREFADRCHHGKEEDMLFEVMIESDFNREAGPVAVMLYKHDVGREKVQVIRKAGEPDKWNDKLKGIIYINKNR